MRGSAWARGGCDRPETSSRRSANPSSRNGAKAKVIAPRQFDEDGAKALRVAGSVVGRQLHADQQHARLVRAAPINHRLQVGLHRVDAQAAQAVVGAQFDDGDHGRGGLRSSASRRASPPLVVSPLMLALTTLYWGACLGEARGQQGDPAAVARQSVFGRKAVAQHEDRRRREPRAGRGLVRRPGQIQSIRSHRQTTARKARTARRARTSRLPPREKSARPAVRRAAESRAREAGRRRGSRSARKRFKSRSRIAGARAVQGGAGPAGQRRGEPDDTR